MQSIALSTDKPLDPDKFFPFIQNLVQVEGPNILRSKGILSLRDDPQRFVFQGVHMMLDGDHQREWRAGRERHEPRRVHRAQPARGEDPQGFRELRGVHGAAARAPSSSSAQIPSVADPHQARSRPARRSSPCISSAAGGVRARRGNAAVRRAGRRGAARRGARRRHPGGRMRRRAHPDRRRRRQGRGDQREGRKRDARDGRRSIAGSIASRSVPTARSPGRPASRRSCATPRARSKSLDLPSSIGGLAFAPKGLRLAVAHYGGAVALVSERAGRARNARLEGLASRRRCSAPTANSSSPACRRRRCTAGA